MKIVQNIRNRISTRMGFFWLLVILFWAKTLVAYFLDFSLGLSNPLDYFTAIFNPIATTILIFGIALYIKKARLFYPIIFILDILNTVLLYLNVIYYREFTDFMTINVMTGYSKVNQGLGGGSLALTKPHDVFFWLDIVGIVILMACKIIKIDHKPVRKLKSFTITSLGCLAFAFNFTLGEIARPQLITRTFDRSYIVKYLGIDTFTGYDAISSHNTKKMRQSATKSQLDDILKFTRQHYAAPNAQYYGKAHGKNVIVLHLESFQQFLIDKKINGKEVTPFLNSIYHSNSTYSFDNFFHQVGQGKTSDAENLLETSTYGLPQGSLFAQLGNDNTFQAAPAILKQQQNYTSAVFHGNVSGFWNRNNTYKNMGYQYFFDASYYDVSGDKSTGYGLKDKLLFNDSIKYLQNLQQPFYAKYITVTNHFPFNLDQEDSNFKGPDTDDNAVNNYFNTAHYLDESIKEFYKYLNKSGLAKNSIVMLYGDHYGLSDTENQNLAPILGENPDNWNDYDNAQLQRVPFMLNMPGTHSGGIDHTYGGEVDVLPTLMHLLGINSKPYIQFGTDLFSKEHDQIVPFRNRDWETPQYTSTGGNVYDNRNGQIIHPDAKLQNEFNKIQNKVNLELSFSDSLNNKDLLRFYHPKGFKTINPNDYNYSDGLNKELQTEKDLKGKSNTILSQNNNKSTTSIYNTNAPEINHRGNDSNRIKITNPDSNSDK